MTVLTEAEVTSILTQLTIPALSSKERGPVWRDWISVTPVEAMENNSNSLPLRIERRSAMPEPVLLERMVNFLSALPPEAEKIAREAVAVLEILTKESNWAEASTSKSPEMR